MKTSNIEKMLEKLMYCGSGEEFKLEVKWSPEKLLWTASILSGVELVTLEYDWETNLISEHEELNKAVEILDNICAEDF